MSSTIAKRQFLNGKLEEVFFLGFPVIFIFIAFFELAFNWSFQENDKLILRFVSDVVFLNGIHVIFTYIALISLEEVSQWAKSAQKNDGLLTKASILLFAFFIFHYWHQNFSQTNIWTWPFLLFVIIYPTHHIFWQCFGILNFYREHPIDKNQKNAFAFLFLIISAYGVIILLGDNNIVSKYDFVFISTVFSILLFLTFAIFLWRLNIANKKLISNHNIFLLCFLLFPLAFVSQTARIGLFATHGLEYFFVIKKLGGNSKSGNRWFLKTTPLLLFLIITSMYLLLFINPLLVFFDIERLNLFNVTAFAAIISALSYTHYYLDRRLFNFRDPSVRKSILPLFFKS